jgi:hypothetical protein
MKCACGDGSCVLCDDTGELPAEPQTWDTAGLQRDFTVKGFLAPFVVVVRKVDGKLGSLEFQASPRIYHSWKED